ncbi:hypothetical protein D8B26_007450 [Coccidioides posadasii str. Silveira]|uniref:Uncharacterized protein n=1 Tax=Coccidioides posadasii (strain RMSCC 757 / Silveira) TaxID=443226 RepID=E9CVA3_COCPS|nr:conserved hypothetical protein [Coccidioides posadasii str. Silveira]QVM12832.1 hypothetical protein D8B26_007450 [Coccidioides posadasii str. Silveira]
MSRAQRKFLIARSNEDDETAQCLLEELSSRRRSHNNLLTRKEASDNHSWAQRAYSSLSFFLGERDLKTFAENRKGHHADFASRKSIPCRSFVRSVADLGVTNPSLKIGKRENKGRMGNGNGKGGNNGGGRPDNGAPPDNPGGGSGNNNFPAPPLFFPPPPPSEGPPIIFPPDQPESVLPTSQMPTSTAKFETVSTTEPISSNFVEQPTPTIGIKTETIVSKITETAHSDRNHPSSPSVAPSSSSISDNGPKSNNFLHDPARVACLAVGVTIATLLLLTLIGWLILRCVRRRCGAASTNSRRSNQRGAPDEVWISEKNQLPNGPGDLNWDPESTFAPPFAGPFRHSRTDSSASSIFRKFLMHAGKQSRRGSGLSNILLREKPLPNPPDTNSELSLTDRDSIMDDLPKMPAKTHATISTRSSEAFRLDLPSPRPRPYCSQEFPGSPLKGRVRGSISKFSWSTPTTKRTSMSSAAPTYRLPSLTSNYAGTVFSEDSEPPHFRTTSSWVLHQQARIMRRKWPESDYPPSPTAVANSISTRQHSECMSPKGKLQEMKRRSTKSFG